MTPRKLHNTATPSRIRLSIRCIAVITGLACVGVGCFSLFSFHSSGDIISAALQTSNGSSNNEGNQIESLKDQLRQQRQACNRMKTVKDIQTCYPPMLVRPLNNASSCHIIENWQDVQRCLTGSLVPKSISEKLKDEPFTIHIIGERHSGTKFVMRELQQCFLQPSASPFVRKVHRDFLRIKHFFQPISFDDYRRHLVVVIVRDPIEWVAAMIAKPYHSPGHIAGFDGTNNNTAREGKAHVIPLPWQDFVSRPWTTHRSRKDEDLWKENQDDLSDFRKRPICQMAFAFDEVVPCQMDRKSYEIPLDLMRGMMPLYEMRRDRSGEPYEHILQLRSDKLVNFVLQLPMLFSLGGFVVVRYEDLLEKGSRFLMEQVARIVGMQDLPSECRPVAPQPERLGQRAIPGGLKKWVEYHLDKEREQLVGYR